MKILTYFFQNMVPSMINKTITILICMLVISSCSKRPKSNLDCDYYKKGIYFIRHTDAFEKQNNIYLERYGINLNTTMDTPDWDEIHQFKVTFISDEKLNLKKTRKKLIYCIKQYLELVNNDNELKTYLYKFPFTHKELSLGISFREKTNERIKGDFIVMCFTNEDLIYYVKTLEDGSLKTIHKETYEDALKILNNSSTLNK